MNQGHFSTNNIIHIHHLSSSGQGGGGILVIQKFRK